MHKKVDNNYNIGTFLNYPIKKFIKKHFNINNEELLKEFNNKYKLNIKDTNIEILFFKIKNDRKCGIERII